MKVHEFISQLDDAKYGRRRVTEDDEVASSPSHAPTSTAQWKTKSTGKSEDEGEKTMGEKDAIKKSDHSIPAPVAKAPSHAPTSTAQWKTSGEKSSDEGEKVSKEAMKENLIGSIIDSESGMDVAEMIAQADLREGGHKAGCKCGFCANKGKFGKKKEDGGEEKADEKDDMQEGMPMPPMGRHGAPPMKKRMDGAPGAFGRPGSAAAGGVMAKRRPMGGGAPAGRMGFRHPAGGAPRPKAALAPYQPSMEGLDKSKNSARTIEEMADKLLEAPGQK